MGYGVTDNLSSGIYLSSPLDDTYRFFKYQWNYYRDTGPSQGVSTGLSIERRNFRKITGNSLTIPAVSLNWTKKLGTGFKAPRLHLQLSHRYLDYNAVACNGPLTILHLALNRNLSRKWQLGGGISVDRRRTAGDKVYDMDGISAFINGRYRVTETLSLNLGFSHRKGDVVIHDLTGWSPPGQKWWPSSGFGVNHRVYQAGDSTTKTVSLGAAQALNSNTLIKVNYSRSTADTGNRTYNTKVTTFSLVKGF
jgi:hypothetical protein